MHVLYRFYNATGDLLYVGITNNPPRRLGEHRDSKEWWLDVARVEIEHHRSRADLADAEKAAIRDESPLHNIAHAVSQPAESTPAASRPLSPYFAGEVYAFRLRGGTCPVGLVVEHDDEGWLLVDLYSWMTGRFTAGEMWIDEAQIFSVLRAAKKSSVDGTTFYMDDLGAYQTEWLDLRSRFNRASDVADASDVRWSIWLDDLGASRQ